MEDFPNYFWNMNQHMFLIKESDTVSVLMPPNQEDWFYTLTKISKTKWTVKGTKDGELYQINKNYKVIDNKWTSYIIKNAPHKLTKNHL